MFLGLSMFWLPRNSRFYFLLFLSLFSLSYSLFLSLLFIYLYPPLYFFLTISLRNECTQINQGCAVGRILITRQNRRCLSDVVIHRASRQCHSTCILHNNLQVIHRRLIVGALREFLNQSLALIRGTLLQHLDKWQGDFTLTQIVVRRLACFGRA